MTRMKQVKKLLNFFETASPSLLTVMELFLMCGIKQFQLINSLIETKPY